MYSDAGVFADRGVCASDLPLKMVKNVRWDEYSTEQCKAVTREGKRCSYRACGVGLCTQHLWRLRLTGEVETVED